MKTDNYPLNFNESVIYALRALYRSHGYSQYKMSKFEEYDLYARNKDFLISDSVITFTDTTGKLMALKPDVTLSIIKNMKEPATGVRKLYYNENVYRISKGTRMYKELMQMGLECIGEIDDFCVCEVISLAAQSLKSISDSCVLDISHLGLLTSLIDSFGASQGLKSQLLRDISEKNLHELTKHCLAAELPPEKIELLKSLVSCCGTPSKVIPQLKALLSGHMDIAPVEQLCRVVSAVDPELQKLLRIDFSVISDANYYNGIVFKGFIDGIPSSVLSGGQYDKLMEKMQRRSGAIGFAVYLDLLERLSAPQNEYDVDVLLLYDDSVTLADINAAVYAQIQDGKRVMAQKHMPADIKYRHVLQLKNSEVSPL